MVPWLLIIALLALGVVSAIGLTQGINLILAVTQNATAIIGLISAMVGAYFLVWIYRKTKKEEDKWIGIGMIIFGAVIGIGAIFLDIIRLLFSNFLFMIMLLGFIMLVYMRKEGILK